MAPTPTLSLTARGVSRSYVCLNVLAPLRHFSSTPPIRQEATLQEAPTQPKIHPNAIGTRREERLLQRSGLKPVGSRRRRAAIRDSQNIPFEQLPYQCFQEARKFLAEDREETLRAIELEKKRIANVEKRDASEFSTGHSKGDKLLFMNQHLSKLKVQADINDPMIKKRFEDGLGDMDRPIYRHLADQKWREHKRKVLEQRLTQMFVIPDLIPQFDLVADISISFGRKNIQPGEMVNSKISANAPTLNVQVFDKGPRLVTIAVVDGDVPNPEKDGFDFRCHFLASNVELSPNNPRIALGELTSENIALPWMPPHAQKGSPYHRLSIFVLQQPDGRVPDVANMKKTEKRLGFNLRAFDHKYRTKPVSASLFRTVWDENTAAVMRKAGLQGEDIEFRRKKPEQLPFHYKVKDGERYR